MEVISPDRILYYVNLARMFPAQFARYIKEQLQSFKDNWNIPLQVNSNYRTNQGKSAWVEALEYMNQFQSVPVLKFHQGLNLAAQDHVIDMVNHDMFDHNSSDGTPFSQRLEKRCGKLYGRMAQCLGTQFYIPGRNFALNTVLGLIVDDGDYTRNHRKSLLSKQYTVLGSGSRLHKDKVITVIDLHTGDSDNNDKNTGSSKITDKYSTNTYTANKPSFTTHTTDKYSQKPSYTQKVSYPSYTDKSSTQFRSSNLPAYTADYKKSPHQLKIQQHFKDEKHDRFGMDRDLDKFSKQRNRMDEDWKDFDRKIENKHPSYRNKFEDDDWKQLNQRPVQKGGRYVVSESTETKTSTINGQKKTITTKKLTYNDGNTEEIVQQTLN